MTAVRARPGRGPRRGAGPHPEAALLEEELERWTAASIITPAQAEAIRRAEAEAHRSVAPPGPSGAGGGPSEAAPSRAPLIAVALGSLGFALAAAAGGIAVSRFWHGFSTWERLTLVAAVAVVLVLAGRAVRGEDGSVGAPLGALLWVAATAFSGFWGGLLATDALGWRNADVAWLAGLSATAVAAALWAWRPSPLQHTATLVSAAVTVGGLAGGVQHVDGRFVGIALWALGLTWIAISRLRVIRPTSLGYALGGVLAIVGSQILGGSAWWSDPLAVTTALGLLAASVPSRSVVLLWVGVAAVFVSVPTAIVRHFGDSLGIPLTLLVAGVALIAVAVLASRLARRVRATPSHPTTVSEGGLVGAMLAVVALVVGLVVGLGQPPGLPSFVSLRLHPDPAITGSIAYMGYDRGVPCVFLTAASGAGTTRSVLCERELSGGPDSLSWNSAGHLVAREYGKGGPRFVEFDTAGQVIDRGPATEPSGKPVLNSARASDGAVLASDTSPSGLTTFTLERPGAPPRAILSVRGPTYYFFTNTTWSSDGRYAAIVDSESRLLIVDVESAQPTARVLAVDASWPAWSPTTG